MTRRTTIVRAALISISGAALLASGVGLAHAAEGDADATTPTDPAPTASTNTMPKGLMGKGGDHQRGPRGKGAQKRAEHAQDSVKRPTKTKGAEMRAKHSKAGTKGKGKGKKTQAPASTE